MMIICSDNIATNMIIDYLGLDTINALPEGWQVHAETEAAAA